MKKRILSMVVIMSLIFSMFATSVLAADEPASADYTLRVAVADSATVYNPGDTVTVEIYASAEAEAEVGSFQFTLDYDGSMLTLGSLAVPEDLVSGAAPNVVTNGATLSCIIGGSYTLTVSNSPVLIATATFTVNTGVATGDTATISLKSVEVNPSGGSSSGTVDAESATISFANIKVTFEAGSNTDMTSQTVYAKYNQMGLYSDETRTTALTADTISGWVSADIGYRLATEALWSDKTNAYTSASVLQQSFTSDVTLTAQAVQQFTVTFAAGTNGRLTGTTTLTVDTGTTLNEVDVPAPNPNTGYVFDGWDTDPVGATITADTTFTARFVDGTYNLTFPTVTGVTFAIGGTTTTQTTVTHSTDTTFTITASGVDVDAVYYSVAGSYPVLITADGNGNYTISGDVITGDVSITITSANKKNQTLTLNYDTLELPISASKDLSALNPVSGNETELAYGLAEGEGFALDGSVLTTPETSDATATIVIYAKETEEYNASEPVAMTVKVVNKAEASVTFENGSATYIGEPLTHEQASTEIEETDGSWAYDYYNANGVKLDSAPTDAGTYTVIATYTSSDSMGIATAYFTITKAAQSISYSMDSVSLHINDTDTAAFINDLTKATVDGDITYASNDTSVATVDENNGEVTIVGAGTATITATAAETANYNKATASYELTVKNHSYTSAITEPTCTEKGYTTYTCSVCGDSYTADETDATGHDYESVVTESTCTKKGYTTYTCKVCGDSYTADDTEATGHTTEIQNAKDATCTEDGYTGDEVCTVCSETTTAGETIPATGHDYEANAVVASTYEEQGYTVYTCTHCGDSYEADYTAVKVIDGTDGNLSTKTTVQELTAVPEGLKNLYSSVDALVLDLISRVTVGTGYTEDNALVYDVVLQYSTDGGKTWITATVDNFPADGITVTLPYPDGTDASYEFTVLHMFTVDSDRLGITAGDTESPTVTKTDDGLVFTLTGLSPVAVSWKAVTTSTTETDTSSQTDTTTESTDTSSTSASSTTSAQTGDETNILLWIVVMFLATSGIAVTIICGRKRKYNR